jgi:hypothetical protein
MIFAISALRCSLQVALLGCITPNLRAVSICVTNSNACLFFYYNTPPSEEEQELASFVDTEFIADFPSPEFKTDYKIITLPYPSPIPKEGMLVFQRYEH